MTPAETHAGVLVRLQQLEAKAGAAQPYGAWYLESGTYVYGRTPLLLGDPEDLEPHELEDWIFTAATRGDAAHIVAQQPQAVLAQLAGRRRIIERHAPGHQYGEPGAPLHVVYCAGPHGNEGDEEEWPCDDWRDAAADLLPLEAP